MKISIVTPVKNLENYISDTIESVLSQRGNFELEYIIIDGGSVDSTLKICQEYKRQIQAYTRPVYCNSVDFKIVSVGDDTMYEGLSNGLQIITGDIVSYINGDDFYMPNALSCVNEIFSNYFEVKWLTGLPLRYNERGHIINFRIPWQYKSGLILKGFYGKQLPFIQQEVTFWRIELNNALDLKALSTYQFAGDYFLWHSFAKQGTQLFIIDSFLGGNRLREGQLSKNMNEYHKEFDSIRQQVNLFDYIKGVVFLVIEKFAGKPVKRRLSKNRISYKQGKWILK